MKAENFLYTYLDDGVSFRSSKATQLRTVYMPLCGTDGTKIKSAITPFLSGDIKVDKSHYITKPTSTEDLRQECRNVFFEVANRGIVSLSQETTPDASHIEVGQLWHKLTRRHDNQGIEVSALNFVPVSGENIELMRVKVKNISDESLLVTPTTSIPLFGRALENKHDHEQVTSLLHRIQQVQSGVLIETPMAFNEEGHLPSEAMYFVLGLDDKENPPIGSFPTVDSFVGDGGTLLHPEAVYGHHNPQELNTAQLNGKEAIGALRFANVTLEPEQEKEYFIIIGMSEKECVQAGDPKQFLTKEFFDHAFAENEKFWAQKTTSILCQTADKEFDSWMRWVVLQPVLRRIYGCSFLPDHDYGKGGKGWRDIWQDLLSLILIEPTQVRETLIDNFAGVRIDGSNATIIGARPGEFLADRNAITRVWMDHGVWPFLTILLYIHQTGDFDILLEQISYFRDPQLSRTYQKDVSWNVEYGNKLKTTSGDIYQGSIIEHLLAQLLVQFFNVGEHNITRLESADWNDGLDMAFDRGESAAFMSMYGGNLICFAKLLEELEEYRGTQEVSIAKELGVLLDSLSSPCDYNDIQAKKKLLFETYYGHVQPELSGEQIDISISDIVKDLRKKGEWIINHLRNQEKVSIEHEGESYSWFNGYYDNKAERVEGKKEDRIWMTLTGQVFPIMSQTATDEDVQNIVKTADRFLKDAELGGYRLNTDFGLRHYLDLGRAFGFAFGTKENGAFFSHMIVMYANALYQRGFAKEGYAVLDSIYAMSVDTNKSKIYPGVPEYFDAQGRGMYHYLTGSASWMVLTVLTQMFGVRGEKGYLILAPQLLAKQFDTEQKASTHCHFAHQSVTVAYHNCNQKEVGEYAISEIKLNGQQIDFSKESEAKAVVRRDLITEASTPIIIDVTLS